MFHNISKYLFSSLYNAAVWGSPLKCKNVGHLCSSFPFTGKLQTTHAEGKSVDFLLTQNTRDYRTTLLHNLYRHTKRTRITAKKVM